VVRISKLLRSWFGGKVLVWDETEAVSSSPGSTEQSEHDDEWQAALAAAEEREWQAALAAAEEREWRALISGAHQKTAAVAPAVVTRKRPVEATRSVETDEQEWSTLLAKAKATATVMMVVPRKPDRDRAWQTVFGKARPGTGASAH
jgi:hypothetical protein